MGENSFYSCDADTACWARGHQKHAPWTAPTWRATRPPSPWDTLWIPVRANVIVFHLGYIMNGMLQAPSMDAALLALLA